MDTSGKLKVINLWAGPGAGKSTTAAGLFNVMKLKGFQVELVTEFAKDLTYDKSFSVLKDQLLVFAEQHHRLFRLEGQVEWAITDSPLPLACIYANEDFRGWMSEAVLGAYNRFLNFDIFVRRVKPYAQYGRNESEAQAVALDRDIRFLWAEVAAAEHTRCWAVPGDHTAPEAIYKFLVEGGYVQDR